MSLLAGIRFIRKENQQRGERGEVRGGGGKAIDGDTRVVDSSELQDDQDLPEEKKRKHKHRKKGKGDDDHESGGAKIKISSKERKKAKADATHKSDEQQHASKRRKSDGNTRSSPTASASVGGDWIDQALAVGEKSNGDDSATAEELAKRARDEEIDLEVVKGLRDPKTKRRYGLFDPLKGEEEQGADRTGGPAGDAQAGFLTLGGGSHSRGMGGGKGLPGSFAPRLLSGVGDKGAGWRAKALKRAREKAEKTGQSLEELVGERWGSLDKLRRDSKGGGASGGWRQGYSRGRDELASLSASEGRIAPEVSASLIGQVGKGGSRSRLDRKGDGDGGRGGRGGRERKLRIGRDAKDTDVLKRFSSKLEDALSRNDDTRRDNEEGHRGYSYSGGAEDQHGDNRQRGGSIEREMKTENDLGWREQEARSGRDPVDHWRRRGDKGKGDEDDGDWHRDGVGERRRGIYAHGASKGRERWSEGSKTRDERQWGRRDSRERFRLDGERGNSVEERGRGSRDRWRRNDSGDRSAKSTSKGEEAKRYHFEGEDSAGDCEARREKGKGGDGRFHGSPSEGRWREREGSVDTDTIDSACDDRTRNDGNPTEADEDSSREDRPKVERWDAEELDGRNRDMRVEHKSGGGLVDRKPDDRSSVDGVDRSLEAPSIPAAGKKADGKVEDAMKAGNGTPVAGSKLLTEAELTKLAVAAMKAKLKGDAATHARLMEEARLGREAIAAAATGSAASPEASVCTASPARWKPGLDLKETEESGEGRGGEGQHGKGEAEKRVCKEGDGDDEIEIVTSFDENGRLLRAGKAELMREDLKSGRRKGKLKEAGGRWAEGANESVAEFVKREREQGFENMDETFLRNVSRLGSKFRGTELGGVHTGLAGEDEEEEVDMRMFQRPEDRMTAVAAAERLRAKAVADHRRHSAVTSRCFLCMDSAGFKKHLVLSLGEHTFLYLATGTRRLSDGHCYIVPIRHTPASTACDEDVWREIDLFKSALRKMGAGSSTSSPSSSPTSTAGTVSTDKSEKKSRKKPKKTKKEKRRSHKEASCRTGDGDGDGDDDEGGDAGARGDGNDSGDGDEVIFLETGGKPGSSSAKHAFIEAVLVPRSAASTVPMYFKQALMEAGEEWATHKKCIAADPRRGGVRRAVPKGFPYFHVEWDGGGYAHVIEGEERKFPRNFGVDTLAGVMGIDPPSFGGKERGHGGESGGFRGSAADEQERKMVMDFLERWKKFDWTSELDGGEYHEGATV